MKKVKILVCCHKQDIMATEEPYMPIHVGRALSGVDLGIQGDDADDNISLKNHSYCELTGMYWAWKNLRDVDVIGLCHYRRYFDFHGQCRRIHPYTVFPTSAFNHIDHSIPADIIDGIKDGTAVVAKPMYFITNLRYDYCCWHLSDDFRTLTDVFIRTQSPVMQRAFYRTMHMNNSLMPANMFIMTWADFDRYCQWLFDILTEIEKRTDISHYNPLQKRLYGYIAERLFNVYLLANDFKLVKRPLLWFNDAPPKPFSTISLLVYRVRGWLNVKLTNPKEYPLDKHQC